MDRFSFRHSERSGLVAFARFSRELSALDTNAQCVLTGNSLYLTGKNKRLNIYSLDGGDIGGSGLPLSVVSLITLDAPEDSLNVLNVRGVSPILRPVKKGPDRTLLFNFLLTNEIKE